MLDLGNVLDRRSRRDLALAAEDYGRHEARRCAIGLRSSGKPARPFVRLSTSRLALTRFRGHLISWEPKAPERSQSATFTTAVSARVPS